MSRVPTKTPRKTPSSTGLRVPSTSAKPTSGLVPPSSPRDRAPPSPRSTTRLTAASSGGTSASSRTASARVPSSTTPKRAVKRLESTESRTEPPASPTKPTSKNINLREAIALKRAEAKKAATTAAKAPAEDSIWNEGHGADGVAQEEDILGRESVPETIERAKRNGNLNLNSRSLSCLPRHLFESHLGITPDALALVPTSNDSNPHDQQVKSSIPSWQAQDLSSLKASDNAILELHHEISLFGGIKHLDLHLNKLQSLPNSLIDLVNLLYLDLSRNELTSLPPNLATLPNLRTLNLSQNQLTSLDLTISDNGKSYDSGSFFAPTVVRATEPLPKLQSLDLSRNAIVAKNIVFQQLPQSLEAIDLSFNQLGQAQHLIVALSKLPRLLTLDLGKSDMAEDPLSLLAQSNENKFAKLRSLKLLGSSISEEAVRQALPSRSIIFDVIRTNRPKGSDELEVILNPPVIKEAWELEAEKRLRPSASRANLRAAEEQASTTFGLPPASTRPVVKEDWEIEAEQGLISEGAKRRMRAAKQAERVESAAAATTARNSKPLAKPVEKEQWEIDAEQGLLTEGAKRRARAMAAQAHSKPTEELDAAGVGTKAVSSRQVMPMKTSSPPPSHSVASYYNESKQTLQLPAAIPRPKTHARAISLAPKLTASDDPNPLLPDATLPLSKIVSEAFASNLRVLTLSNRRVNQCFELPSLGNYQSDALLPSLDELNLDSCGLTDNVAIKEDDATPRSQPLLTLVANLFPSLSVLNISQNSITNLNGVANLFIPDWDMRRKGLKVFKAQGNRISDLDGLSRVCDGWKNEAKVDGWRLEEMDLRDNEIPKLPAELGLLPLDVLLVEGNVFRVPARRVWEREGTKGLLLWLRQRLEA